MRLFWLVALTMTAFASNSILNRQAMVLDGVGPSSYAAIRLLAGALLLTLLVALRTGPKPQFTQHAFWSAGTLALYALAFSYAYITIPTGAGALILFGAVQVISFGITLIKGQKIGALSWIGALLAFAGLCYLLWPSESTVLDTFGVALMLVSALGWMLFTIAGKQGSDPLGATTLAFVLAAPIGIVFWVILPDAINLHGALLAILSGAVTSGMGYALWYKVLPYLSLPTASVAQLTVPVIAALGGALVLGETLTFRFALATCLVLFGVWLTIFAQRKNR
jgi:drug/metabolite transporter (DMT)-like permease